MNEVSTQVQGGSEEYTPKQIEVIKRNYAVGATNDELMLFLKVCKVTGLSPIRKQIYFIKRGTVGTFQVGIDGLRAIAERSGVYAGNCDPVFEYDNPLDTEMKSPTKATVTVKKFVAGQLCEFTATARMAEYKPEKNAFMWERMPHAMLGKTAEALALRKAFPGEMSGLYTHEEMDQAGGRSIITESMPELKAVKKQEQAKPEPSTDEELPTIQVEGEVDEEITAEDIPA